MASGSHAEEKNPLVQTLLAGLGLAEGAVCLAVDPRDEMLGFLEESRRGDRERALFTYFQSGHSIADAMLQVLRWRFGELGRLRKLLDFASGYGRVTRFLLRDLAAERIWVSDIYAGGVRFQEERLGVHGIVSTLLPEDFAPGEVFDAILVTSLFTHLPAGRFVAWLRVLMGLLAPGGVLIFSVHGQGVLPAGCEIPASGILFQEISESGSLAGSDYGSAWVSEEFVRRALREACASRPAESASLRLVPRGLCNYQDLCIAVPGEADFSRLCFRHEPFLYIERFDLVARDELALSGWAGTLGSGSLHEVQLRLDGEPLLTCPIALPRPDVAELLGDVRYLPSGWSGSCRLPAGRSRSGSLVQLGVLDDRGVVFPALACSLESALLDSARLEAGGLRHDLARLHGELGAAAAESEALRRRIAAMEASRFWKLRNRWFQLKGLLRLTREERDLQR